MTNQHKEKNNQAKAIKPIAFSLIKKLKIIFASSGLILPICIIVIVLLVSASIGALIGENDNFDEVYCEKCQEDYDMVKEIVRPYYYRKALEVDEKVDDYVKDKLDIEIKPGNLTSDDDTMGSWEFNGYGDTNLIKVEFLYDFEDGYKTIASYVEAVYTNLENTRDSFKFMEELKENPNMEFELKEPSASKQENIIELFKKDLKANADDLFYIAKDFDEWESDIKLDKFIVEEEVKASINFIPSNFDIEKNCMVKDNGRCMYHQVGVETYKVQDFLESDIDYAHREILRKNGTITATYPIYETNSKNEDVIYGYQYIYSYMDEVEKEGVVGTIKIPININVDDFMKEEKEEIFDKISKLYKDKSQLEIEVEYTNEINSAIYAAAEGCGYKVDLNFLGSGYLIGVGNNGYFGESLVPEIYERYKYDNSKGYFDDAQIHGPAFFAVWRRCDYDLRPQGLIYGYEQQCTAFAQTMFYDLYGIKCSAGHGKEVASNIVKEYPDKFKLSSEPAPGAVLSCGLNHRYGHVAIVHAVHDDDGDGVWDRIMISDGNVDSHGGVRIMAEYDRANFQKIFYGNSQIYAVPIREVKTDKNETVPSQKQSNKLIIFKGL